MMRCFVVDIILVLIFMVLSFEILFRFCVVILLVNFDCFNDISFKRGGERDILERVRLILKIRYWIGGFLLNEE